MKIQFTIPLDCLSLKNQKRTRRGQSGMFDSGALKSFKADFALLVPVKYRNLGLGSRSAPLRVDIGLFHRDWRSDADAEAVYDALQEAGVISNDRWVRRKWIDASRVDAENPRCEIMIEEFMVVAE